MEDSGAPLPSVPADKSPVPMGGPLMSAFKSRLDPVELSDGWANSCASSPRGSGAPGGHQQQSLGPPSFQPPTFRGGAEEADLGKLSWKIQAILESNKAAVERSMYELHEKSYEQMARIQRQVEGVSEALQVTNVASRLQSLQGFAERLEALHLQQSESLARTTSGGLPQAQQQQLQPGPQQQQLQEEGTMSKGALTLIADEFVDRLQPTHEEQLSTMRRMQRQLDQMESSFKTVKASVRRGSLESSLLQRPSVSTEDSSVDSEGNPKNPPGPPGEKTRRPSVTSIDRDREDMKAVHNDAAKLKDTFEKSKRKRKKPTSWVEWTKGTLDGVSALLILANMIWMAIEIEIGMNAVREQKPNPGWLEIPNIGFAVCFSLELILKLSLYRLEFFVGRGWKWNVFDCVLVIFQIIDLVFSTANLTFFRLLRGLRAIRAARIIRTVRLVRELRLMVASITCSLGSLFWAFVLLILVLFLCAMGVQQTLHSSLEQSGLADVHPDLMKLYGNLFDTMLSLFMAISGGMDWKDLVEPLERISKLYLYFYIMFVILVIFGLLNILTAVFVEATNKIAEVDADLVITDQLDDEGSAISKLNGLLQESDDTGTGHVTRETFEAKLGSPEFRAQLKLLDLNIFDAQSVFKLVVDDNGGEVPIEDVVYGLMRLRGSARSMDMATVLYENKRLLTKLGSFMKVTDENFQGLHTAISSGMPLPPRGAHHMRHSAKGPPGGSVAV